MKQPIRLIAAILPILFSLPAHAERLEGSKTTEWEASPEHHKVTIQREAADEMAKKLIAAAEKSQPDAAALAKAVPKKDPGFVRPQAGAWWNKQVLGVRIPYALTADAVQYYSELVKGYGQQKFVRFDRPSSEFTYHAKVSKHAAFELNGKSLQNVTVVTMIMNFHQNYAAFSETMFGFKKSRVVVFDKDGKILGVQGDGDVEVLIAMH